VKGDGFAKALEHRRKDVLDWGRVSDAGSSGQVTSNVTSVSPTTIGRRTAELIIGKYADA
jgi:hypothetical protein